MKAVIMSGGLGTRFWPASRSHKPKQFLRIVGRKTLLQQTFDRLLPLLSRRDIFFVCSPEYARIVHRQIPDLEKNQLILEPASRNTAPCIGLAAHYLAKHFPDEVMAVLPADHVIGDIDTFQRALEAAESLARKDWLVTFGIEPTRPATGYGYIEIENDLGFFSGFRAFSVRRFAEKPDLETAREYVRGGQHYWNSGMFVWRTSSILEEIAASQPDLAAVLQEMNHSEEDPARANRLFEGLSSLSIDYAVMEHSSRVAVIPARLQWDDVGDWRALMDHLPGDREGNHSNTDLVPLDTRNCLAYSQEGKLVALLGVEDLVVVDTEDALLVCHRKRTQEVKQILDIIDDKLR